jgi:glycosyltransferase involved in cell wall biosynthesis
MVSCTNLSDSMADLAVIMSVYKNDKLEYLEESIFSILNQTYSNFIFYIVLDGPVSPSCDSFLTRLIDSRIKIFRLEKNEGLAVALNFLLRKVLKEPGIEYIARMDADDISVLNRFEKQRKFLLAFPEIFCIGSWVNIIDENKVLIANSKLPEKHDDIKRYYSLRSPLAHPSVMFRRSFIENTGFYPTDTFLMEDNALWGNALRCGLKFANLPEYLLKYRMDKTFFSRRSGFYYGWNYIKTKFVINKKLKMPIQYYVLSFIIGVVKMMPSFLLRFIYNFKWNFKLAYK